MTLDDAIFFAGIVLVAALWAALIIKRVFRVLPCFFSLLCLNFFQGLSWQLVERYSPGWNVQFVLVSSVLIFLLYFCVLFELGKNILRCNRTSASQRSLAVFLFVSALLLAYFVTGQTSLPNHSWLSNVYVLTMWTANILQFAGFLALVWWSSAAELEWPDREFQVATGLGISAITWFAVAILHTWWTDGAAYHKVDQAGQTVDLLVYAYWLHYFWIVAKLETKYQPAHAKIPGNRSRKSGNKTGIDVLRVGPAETAYTAAPNPERE